MASSRHLFFAFLPALLSIAMVFLITGASLATLPLYIHQDLGYGPSVVGFVAALQFIVALISRVWAGRMADAKGPKTALVISLVMTFAAGGFYLGSAALQASPPIALALLMGARTLLGGAESFIITSCQSWGLALAGRSRTAEVIGQVGVALYVSLALGAPMGSAIYGGAGFLGIAALTLLIPLASLALVRAGKARRHCRRPSPRGQAYWHP